MIVTLRSISYLVIALLLCFSCESPQKQILPIESDQATIGSKDDPNARATYELRMLVDPVTNQLPQQIRQKELKFAKELEANNSRNASARTNTLNWFSSGPSNVGGRTRALAIDSRNENTLIAGGVSGGMYKTTDGGLNWVRTSNPGVVNSITCLIQDQRIGHKRTWYYGTGELRGNSARAVQAPYRGDGIFKSTDNGDTWQALSPTQNNQLTIFESPFNYVWNLAINTTRTDVDEVYAALYGGVVRSQDGGSTWQTVLGEDLINDTSGDLNDSNAPFYTNIMITPTGKMYAYLSTSTGAGDENENKGIFYSENGTDWQNITPVGFEKITERLVMDYAATDESILYFLLQGQREQLWKLDGNDWSNLSNFIPANTDLMEAYDSQDSYNMTINIHPENPSIVYLGGTNLYRSLDGFTSNTKTQQIGGYDIENINKLYESHHPDQHDVVFFEDGDVMLSANDGGVFKTFNNKASEVSWVSLNNGYVTTQFYSVAVSQKEDSPAVIGGMQDNGTYLKTSLSDRDAWTSVLGGDGAYCAATPNIYLWYASFQQGRIYKMNFTEEGVLTNWARIDPVTADEYLFITPFVLDPNNYNRMYLVVDGTIWRNDNLSQIPDQEPDPTRVNWTEIHVTDQNVKISTISISAIPAHTLYYGDMRGYIYKVTEANSLEPTTTPIFDFPGYPSSIGVDPLNADRVLVAYSNYNIPSLFFSDDGGITFKDVGGNLEENEDGTGNGPSIRWVEIVPLEDGSYQYYAATSTGLYSTAELIENETVWVKEGLEIIGNGVVSMIDYRSSDGKMVVATHGNGMFYATIPNTKLIDVGVNVPDELTIVNGFPNPFQNSFNIQFTIPDAGPLAIYVIDVNGRRVKILLNYPQFQGEVLASWDGRDGEGNPVGNGLYHYVILYKDGVHAGKMFLSR